MMKRIMKIMNQSSSIGIGLMSGTSVDGIDAAIVEIHRKGIDTIVDLLAFKNYAYPDSIQERIFKLFDPKTGTVDQICHMNFLLGNLFADAALKIIEEAGLKPIDVDFIGSHGQTIYHMPELIQDTGYDCRSTLQIGEPSVIAERTGIVTVGDFRVRDVAALGQGAPLVPYTEYLLYAKEDETLALQNIGGIGNVTVLPAGGTLEQVMAFDTGPGNMIMDELVRVITKSKQTYDKDGELAGQGIVCEDLLNELMKDPYFHMAPPKTTGREYFGKQYVEQMLGKSQAYHMKPIDLIATATALTSKSIAHSYEQYILPKHQINRVLISGGGSYNKTLINFLKRDLQGMVVQTQEEIGLNSDAKEAIAFAILANETLHGNHNNIPQVTGAKHGVVMGKITF